MTSYAMSVSAKTENKIMSVPHTPMGNAK